MYEATYEAMYEATYETIYETTYEAMYEAMCEVMYETMYGAVCEPLNYKKDLRPLWDEACSLSLSFAVLFSP